MACRNLKISKGIQSEIRGISKNINKEFMELEVSSCDSISTFCSEFKEKYPRLDI